MFRGSRLACRSLALEEFMVHPAILVCDDEPAIRKTLAQILEDEDYRVTAVGSAEALLSALRGESRFDLVMLDVWLPGMDGLDALNKVKAGFPDLPVVMISGHANMDTAVKAVRDGAFDFLEKPLNMDKVLVTIANALKQARLEKKQRELAARLPSASMVGDSPRMVRLREDLALAAPSPGRVLILGESGCGKELAARTIHQLSDRRDEPFVEMNCAAIPEELIESELFGHVKGSFTGAVENRKGKFLQADRGTLFLDEIGDMSLTTQAKVLRVLQEQRFQPVGSAKTMVVDVRVIAATNKDLREEIREGRFREDLFFRLNVIPLEVPPLRERLDDLPLLIDHFQDEFCRSYGRKSLTFSQEAMVKLASYRWPGNVRELRNVVERLIIMSRAERIQETDLPPEISGETHADSIFYMPFESLKEAREHFEKRYIEVQLQRQEGNITKTAEALKMERSNLHKKIKQLGIETGG